MVSVVTSYLMFICLFVCLFVCLVQAVSKAFSKFVYFSIFHLCPFAVGNQEYDINKDGVISPKEFRRAMELQKIYTE